MNPGRKTARALRGACIAAGLAFFFGPLHAAGDLRIAINGDSVTIKADGVSIRSVRFRFINAGHILNVQKISGLGLFLTEDGH